MWIEEQLGVSKVELSCSDEWNCLMILLSAWSFSDDNNENYYCKLLKEENYDLQVKRSLILLKNRFWTVIQSPTIWSTLRIPSSDIAWTTLFNPYQKSMMPNIVLWPIVIQLTVVDGRSPHPSRTIISI